MKQGDGQVDGHGSVADSLSCLNMLRFHNLTHAVS